MCVQEHLKDAGVYFTHGARSTAHDEVQAAMQVRSRCMCAHLCPMHAYISMYRDKDQIKHLACVALANQDDRHDMVHGSWGMLCDAKPKPTQKPDKACWSNARMSFMSVCVYVGVLCTCRLFRTSANTLPTLTAHTPSTPTRHHQHTSRTRLPGSPHPFTNSKPGHTPPCLPSGAWFKHPSCHLHTRGIHSARTHTTRQSKGLQGRVM